MFEKKRIKRLGLFVPRPTITEEEKGRDYTAAMPVACLRAVRGIGSF